MAVYKKQISVGKWLKKGEDYKDRDVLIIGNEGRQVEGTYGVQNVFLVKTPSGAEGNLSFNQTSINNLIDIYGEDSVNWIGKKARVWLILQQVSGKMTKVPYLAHPDAEIEETADGFEFVVKKEATKPNVKPNAPTQMMSDGTVVLNESDYPEIDPNEIPF